MLEGRERLIPPSMMANKEYFLYGGLFIAGAVLTPVVTILLKGGGDPFATTANGGAENSELISSDFAFESDTPTAATFAENDSQEEILNDYSGTSLDSLRNIPTTIPQYAANQPAVRPYPNYWANIRIPTFNSAPLTPRRGAIETSPEGTTGDRPAEKMATLPTLGETFSESFQPNSNITAQPDEDLQLQGSIQAPNPGSLQNFVNSIPARDLKLP